MSRSAPFNWPSGADVTAITAPAKAPVVQKAGAARTLPREAIPEEVQYDVVIDIVGGPGFGALIRALKPGGRYAVSGAIAGPLVEADLREIYLSDRSILGATYQPPVVFARLVDLMNSGSIRPLISTTYPLQEIATAQAMFEAKTHPGKLVLLPPETDR